MSGILHPRIPTYCNSTSKMSQRQSETYFPDLFYSQHLREGFKNLIVYAEMTSTLPPTKVVRESNLDYSLTWSRLNSSVVDARARDVMYLMIHNKLPVKERLFRIRLRNDPYCMACATKQQELQQQYEQLIQKKSLNMIGMQHHHA